MKVIPCFACILRVHRSRFFVDPFFHPARSVARQVTMSFEPMVEPSFEVTTHEANARRALLCRASQEDHDWAVQRVTEAYQQHLQTRTARQKRLCPSQAPPKFVAARYFKLLEQRLVKASGTPFEPLLEADNVVRVCDLPFTEDSSSSAMSAVDLLLSGQGFFFSASTDIVPASYKSALDILQCREDGHRCHFQGVLVVCDEVPRAIQYGEGSPRRRKGFTEGKVADMILVDKTGPVSACLWGDAAEDVCTVWRNVQEKRQRKENAPAVVELSNARIQPALKNEWNGELLTRVSSLTSIESHAKAPGTTVRALAQATAPNLTEMTFQIPPTDCCVSVFGGLQSKLSAPFRLSVKGVIIDLQPLEKSAGGNWKRVFDVVDSMGSFFTCCAMLHNAESQALRNLQEVVLFFGTGRASNRGAKGMLYLLKDAMIIPVGTPGFLPPKKTEQMIIN